MNKSLLVPILMLGSVIYLSSELLTVPPNTPLHSMYVQFDAAAHVFLYFFLGFFVANYVSVSLQVRTFGVLVLTGALCLAFGVGDEFHQMYVPDRGAEFRDLFWDLVGAMAGCMFFVVLAGLTKWVREFLSSSEVSIGRMLGRAFVALTLLVGILVPAVAYAGTIAGFVHSVSIEGSLFATSVIKSFLQKSSVGGTPALQKLESLRDMMQKASENLRTQQAIASTGTAPSNSVPERESSISREVSKQYIDSIKKQLTLELRQEILRELKGAAAAGLTTAPARGESSDQSPAMVVSTVAKVAEPQTKPEVLGSTAKKPTEHNKIIQARGGSSQVQKAIRTAQRNRQARKGSGLLGVGSRKPDPCDLVAVIAPSSNPVNELSLDQIRRVFSGEYQNWSELGGPDVPIKVVIVRKRSGNSEKTVTDHMKASIAPNAIRLPYVSLMIPLVAGTKGSVGFLHVQNTEQLDFISEHEKFKRIAIRKDNQAPAVLPNRIALNIKNYPIMK